jgi:hypothetical protein
MNLGETIAAARSVGGHPFEAIDVRFSSLGEMLARHAASTPDRL